MAEANPGREPLLSVRGVEAGYGAARVLFGVDLDVGEGEVVCLLGGNAAGKTTTMRCIVGALPIQAGTVLLTGERISGRTPSDIVARGLAIVPEGRRIFPRLTVQENLDLGAYGRRDGEVAVGQDMERIFGFFPRLAERRGQFGGTLSGGEQQMLAIARALMARPRLLLMDEPSMGLAPALVDQVFDIIRDIHRGGTAILLVEQNARLALGVAGRGYVLQQGRVVAGGTSAELLASPAVQEAYLGGH
jgi:branched-chain amino acid transport system ATP-binding protein